MTPTEELPDDALDKGEMRLGIELAPGYLLSLGKFGAFCTRWDRLLDAIGDDVEAPNKRTLGWAIKSVDVAESKVTITVRAASIVKPPRKRKSKVPAERAK